MYLNKVHIRHLTGWITGLCLLLAAGIVGASEMTPYETAAKLQETYDKISSISAEFRQTTFMKMSRRARHGAGSVVFQKPGRMRWDYSSPAQQVLVCDGRTFYMYFAKEEQMMAVSADQYLKSDVTYSFFAGTGNILRDFDVLPPDEDVKRTEAAEDTAPGTEKLQGGKSIIIKLVPRNSHPQINYIHVWTEDGTFLTHRIRIVDQFGSVTDLFFTDIKVDQEIPVSRFTFIPPPGTEVIEP
ncbi:MAG: outer membrane lipoprotein carrier protein LolA [Thermodesulfobacteriota bacterium]|nr:outer membrane lipoprotein carrier protein LolA [Thermodesulfobacteriota bacterium]